MSYKKQLHNDEGFDGTFNRRTGDLHIDAGLSGRKRDKILGHEVMEVIKENYELDISERDMSRAANGWVEFLYQLGIEFDWSEIRND